MCVCVCAHVRACVCVLVCVITQKIIDVGTRNMKLKYIAVYVYENISDKFDNGHCQIKVKVMVGL